MVFNFQIVSDETGSTNQELLVGASWTGVTRNILHFSFLCFVSQPNFPISVQAEADQNQIQSLFIILEKPGSQARTEDCLTEQ